MSAFARMGSNLVLTLCCAASVSLFADVGSELGRRFLPPASDLLTFNTVSQKLHEMDVDADEAWLKLSGREEYDAYRTEMHRKMISAIGGFPERTPLNARTVATVKRDGYRIEKVVFESMPNLFVTANLFIPESDAFKAPYPAVVMSCGHADEGKDCDIYLRACVIAVKQGFVALMYDPYEQGERREFACKGSTTHHNILFFTNRGRVYRQKGYEIPEAGRTAKGTAIINLLPLTQGEKITAVIPVKEFVEDQFLFMATNRGTVKKMNLKDLESARKAGIVAINLDDKEDLIGVELTDGNSEIILATRNGLAIRFDEQDVRPMGRTAHGVRGVALNYGDEVVAMDSVPDENYEVLTATEFGMGKRTAVSEYRKQTRGGKGIINIKITEKTGLVIGMKVINPAQEIMMITAAGKQES